MPSANGSHDQAVPLAGEVVARRRSPRTTTASSATPGPIVAAIPTPRTADVPPRSAPAATETRPDGIGLRRLAPSVGRGVDQVVQGADGDLQRGHRAGQPSGDVRLSPGEQGDRGDDEPVEDRREGMDEADQRRRCGRPVGQT